MKETLIKNSILTAIVLILVGLRRFVFNILVGRNFGPTELGFVNIAFSTVIIIGTFVSFYKVASAKYISEYLGKNDVNSANAVFRVSFFSTLVLSIISITIMFIMKDWYVNKIGIEASYFLFVLVLIPLSAFYLHFNSIYYGINKVKQYFVMEIFTSTIFFIFLGISIIYLKSAFLLPFILAYLFFFILSLYHFRTYFKSERANENKITLEMSKFSSFVLIGNLVGVVGTEFSVLLTSYYVSAEWIGYYVAAYALLKPLQLVPSILRPVLYPTQSYQYGKGDYDLIKKTLNISTQWLTVLSSFICGIYILLSDSILETIFGVQYTFASSTMQILSIGMFFGIITVPVNSTLIGTKYVRTQAIISITILLAMAFSWVLLIPSYGIIGTAIGLGIGQFILMILLMYYGWKLFDLDLKETIQTIFYFALILATSFMIQHLCFYYSNVVSISIFFVLFTLVNRKILQDICMNIISTIKNKTSFQ